MSNRRTRTSRNRDDELDNLVSKLQTLLPASSSGCNKTRVSAAKILQETCNYIKSLRSRGDDLSERLSQLLESMENNGVEHHQLLESMNTIRDLLQQ